MRVIGLAGWSGAGKTTLVSRLIPALGARGMSVSTLKHAHHGFDVDTPGKDSHMHRLAGAREVLVSSGRRWALMRELRGEAEATLAELLARLSPVDLVIVEGFRRAPHARIEVHRRANGKPFLHPGDPLIRAIATDDEGCVVPIERFALDDVEAIAAGALRHAEPLESALRRLKGA